MRPSWQHPLEKKMPKKRPTEDAEGKGKAQDKGKAGQRQGEGNWPIAAELARQWMAHEDNEAEKERLIGSLLAHEARQCWLIGAKGKGKGKSEDGKGNDTGKDGKGKDGKGKEGKDGKGKAMSKTQAKATPKAKTPEQIPEDDPWSRRLKMYVDRWHLKKVGKDGKNKGREKGLGFRV